eukprot:3932043-Rhodomonas_salina.6
MHACCRASAEFSFAVRRYSTQVHEDTSQRRSMRGGWAHYTKHSVRADADNHPGIPLQLVTSSLTTLRGRFHYYHNDFQQSHNQVRDRDTHTCYAVPCAIVLLVC